MTVSGNFYITTAIPYVNVEPHLLENVPTAGTNLPDEAIAELDAIGG